MKGLLVLVAALAFLGSGTAVPAADGNSGNAKLCLSADWSTMFASADGSSFKNAGDCISYGAQGGMYTQLKLVPCVAFPGGVCWTVTGFGLKPGTLVTLFFDFLGGGSGNSNGFVPADGTISPGVPEIAVSCAPGLEEHYSTFATG